MRLFSTLPYKFIPLEGTLDPATPEMAFIVKASFALEHGRLPVPLPAEEQVDFLGDDRFMDKIGRSLRYSSDLLMYKPFGEVLLVADCHAPGGALTLEAGLDIGPISKRLQVFGDRVWRQNAQGRFEIEGPLPFVRMPLRWERAYGGLANPRNPLGRGLDPWTAEDGRKFFYLANIEAQKGQPLRFGEALPTLGFGPVSPQWQPRLAREGTRDLHWANFVAPLPPRDYDPAAAQAAPEDQWIEGYWNGAERIELANLHPEHPRFVTALPGKRLRLFVEVMPANGDRLQFAEVPLNLDTIHIDMTTARLHLVWRQRCRPRQPGGREFHSAYLAEEPLAEEPAPLEAHYREFRKLKGPEPEPLAAQIKRDEQAALAEARKTMVDAKLDPKIIAQFDAAPDSQAKFTMMMDLMKAKTSELEAMTAALGKR
jgi:hypothetical protein